MSHIRLNAMRFSALGPSLSRSSMIARPSYRQRTCPLRLLPHGMLIAATISTGRALLSHQQKHGKRPLDDDWTRRVFRQDIQNSKLVRANIRINERLSHARNTIKDPAKLEREMTRLLAERDILGAFQEASHAAYQGTRTDSLTGLGAVLSKLVRAHMYFLKLCFIKGPWNEIGSRRWILATKMITLPLFIAGATYVAGRLAMLVVRTVLWI